MKLMFWIGWVLGVAVGVRGDALRVLREPGHFVIMRHALAPGGGDP
jgi:hypothetical protein